jgi:DNA-binding winged helix-turn-helix (wHTH) protein/Tol biopolymer transport system component
MDATAHRIGDWTLDHARLRLVRGAQEHRLPRLQYDLLCVLLEHAGRLVSRETLIERAWQRQVVGDEVLSRQIASLRQCLGDDAREPRYIETVPKVGYRLLAAVAVLAQDAAPIAEAVARVDASPPPAPAPRAPHRRLLLAGVAVALVATIAFGLARRGSDRPGPAWTAATLAGEHALASDPELESAPRLSRDGRWLAYARRAAGAQRSSVWLARGDGGGARELFEADGLVLALAFAPDSGAIAFVEHGDAGCRVRRHALPDGPRHTLHACGAARGLDWSPDGRLLAFAAPADGDPRSSATGLLALPLDGGAARALTTPPPAAGPDDHPRWSPDGTRLAFARGSVGEQQLMLARGAGGPATRLGIDDRNRIGGLAWSDDGRQLLVAMDPGGSPALHAVALADGARTWLGARGIASLDVAAGTGLVHEVRRYDANLWQVALDAERAPRRLTPSTHYDAQPALAPDGQSVAYASTASAATSIRLVGPDGGEAGLDLPAGLWTRPAFAPDGRSLALTHYVDGRPRAAIHDLETGRTRILDPPDAAAVAFAADGSLVAIVRIDGTPRLARWREGTPPVALAGTEGVLEFRTGARFVAWLAAGAQDLRVIALDGPDATPAVPPRPAHSGAFAFAGARLAVVVDDAASGQGRLWRFDPADGTSQALGTLPAPTASGPGLAVDAAWGHAVVARIDALEADLWRAAPPRR